MVTPLKRIHMYNNPVIFPVITEPFPVLTVFSCAHEIFFSYPFPLSGSVSLSTAVARRQTIGKGPAVPIRYKMKTLLPEFH